MAWQKLGGDPTDEEIIWMLRDAAEELHADRLVRCDNEDELRALFAALPTRPA